MIHSTRSFVLLPILVLASQTLACSSRDDGEMLAITQADDLTAVARWSLANVISFVPARGSFPAPGAIPALAVTYDRDKGFDAPDSTVLHALRADGAELWRVSLGMPADATPAIAADGTIYTTTSSCELRWPTSYATSADFMCTFALVALDPSTGATKWSVAPTKSGSPDRPTGEVRINPVTGDIYASYGLGQTFAAHSNGTLFWERPSFRAAVVSPEGVLVGVDRGSYLTGLAADGEELWSIYTDVVSSGPVRARDGNIYLGDWHGNLRAFTSGGRSLWARAVSKSALRGAPVVMQDGSVAVLHDSRTDDWSDDLVVVDSAGAERWASARAFQPMLATDGRLLVPRFGSDLRPQLCSHDIANGAAQSCIDGNLNLLAVDGSRIYARRFDDNALVVLEP